MHLKSILLKDFRNIASISLSFNPQLNIFVGPNAQGKTNLLEAIYFLSFGRSFRLADYHGLVAWGGEKGLIRAWVNTPLGDEEFEVHLDVEEKKLLKNGKKSSFNQFAILPLVLFSPEALLLLKEAPQARRDYIDALLIKTSPPYGDYLHNYKKALGQRNKLLKNEQISSEEKKRQMTLWEAPLIEHGIKLIGERRPFIGKNNRILSGNYNTIAGGGEKEASWVYQPHTEPEDLSARFQERRDEEVERGITLVGPHRDEFLPCLNGEAIRSFGSQGEMRSFILALKLTEITLFEEVLERAPILLLDDVLSELDERRSEYFFHYLESFRGQVFATATSKNLFPRLIGTPRTWEVKGGEFSLLA